MNFLYLNNPSVVLALRARLIYCMPLSYDNLAAKPGRGFRDKLSIMDDLA